MSQVMMDHTPGDGRLSRRTVLRGTAFGLTGITVAAASGCGSALPRTPLSTVGTVDFKNPLWIPPLAESSTQGAVRSFALTLQAGESEIVDQKKTETWGVNGPLLGPTLRAKRGDQVKIELRNDLDEETVLHWHGMRVPAMSDGSPHHPVSPGSSWSPQWTVEQPAATLWYHPHPHGSTERHTYRGLAGFFILDDDEEAALDLPREYGVDDIVMIVQDRTFDDQGQLVETQRRDNGMLGDTLIVNGTFAPTLQVTAELTRLRIVNGSAARSYNFGFSDGRSFQLIGTDGGLLTAPVRLDRIQLTPAERVEIVVGMKPGEEVTLRSFPQTLVDSTRVSARIGADDELDVMLLRAAGELTSSPAVPGRLAAIDPLDPKDAVQTRPFLLRNNRINRLSMDMNRIDARVKAETVEIWEVRNTHTRPHNFHIHDVQFQILDIDGEAPPAELAGWKDTVYTPPGVRLRLIMRFLENPDASMAYMFHCHLLWHEDQGMMGQFLVE